MLRNFSKIKFQSDSSGNDSIENAHNNEFATNLSKAEVNEMESVMDVSFEANEIRNIKGILGHSYKLSTSS